MCHEDIFPFNMNADRPYMSPLPTELPSPSQHNGATDDIFCTDKTDKSPGEPDEPNHDPEETFTTSDDTTRTPDVPPASDVTPVRKSSRTVSKPSWMNDYMMPHNTRTANIASISAVARQYVQPKFHCFLSTLTKSRRPYLL